MNGLIRGDCGAFMNVAGKKTPRVLAVASRGGHWVQLLRLRPAWDGCQTTYVTTEPGYRDEVLADAAVRAQPTPRFEVVPDGSMSTKLALARQMFAMLKIIVMVRPDVIISTGAAPGFFAIWIGRLFRAKTIWVDSIANAEEMSLSGRKVGRYATLWLTQWKHLERPEGPKHWGGVL